MGAGYILIIYEVWLIYYVIYYEGSAPNHPPPSLSFLLWSVKKRFGWSGFVIVVVWLLILSCDFFEVCLLFFRLVVNRLGGGVVILCFLLLFLRLAFWFVCMDLIMVLCFIYFLYFILMCFISVCLCCFIMDELVLNLV